MSAVVLHPDVIVEPLYQRWFAWPHLVAPATAALNVRRRHLPIMDSFLAAPAVHRRFARDPAMIGGPYMDLPADARGAIEELRAQTLQAHAPVIELADALVELDLLLSRHACGFALEPLYARVPAPLRGLVELFYDRSNRPGYRVLESLLYRTPSYARAAQSIALRRGTTERRSFVLSTPRLAERGTVELPVEFADPRLDLLFRARTEPTSLGALLDALPGLDPALFVAAPPLPPPPRAADLRVRYIGHACVLVETPALSILVDPAVTAFAELPPVLDYVLITHDHQDHVLLDTLLQLRHKIRRVVVPRGGGALGDPSLRLIFRALGFCDVIELDELETLALPDGRCARAGA